MSTTHPVRVVADFLVVAGGVVWAYVAGRHSIIIARDGWPNGEVGFALMSLPFLGIASELVLIVLTYLGHFRDHL